MNPNTAFRLFTSKWTHGSSSLSSMNGFSKNITKMFEADESPLLNSNLGPLAMLPIFSMDMDMDAMDFIDMDVRDGVAVRVGGKKRVQINEKKNVVSLFYVKKHMTRTPPRKSDTVRLIPDTPEYMTPICNQLTLIDEYLALWVEYLYAEEEEEEDDDNVLCALSSTSALQSEVLRARRCSRIIREGVVNGIIKSHSHIPNGLLNPYIQYLYAEVCMYLNSLVQVLFFSDLPVPNNEAYQYLNMHKAELLLKYEVLDRKTNRWTVLTLKKKINTSYLLGKLRESRVMNHLY